MTLGRALFDKFDPVLTCVSWIYLGPVFSVGVNVGDHVVLVGSEVGAGEGGSEGRGDGRRHWAALSFTSQLGPSMRPE